MDHLSGLLGLFPISDPLPGIPFLPQIPPEGPGTPPPEGPGTPPPEGPGTPPPINPVV